MFDSLKKRLKKSVESLTRKISTPAPAEKGRPKKPEKFKKVGASSRGRRSRLAGARRLSVQCKERRRFPKGARSRLAGARS